MTDDLAFLPGDADPTVIVRPPKVCRRHAWVTTDYQVTQGVLAPAAYVRIYRCARCGKIRDDVRSRRTRNNGKRGRSDELTVARMLGGRKVGPLGHPWDVEVPGYLRVQSKQTDHWPSLAKIIEWLDAIPVGPEMRGVTLADTPGSGGRTRRYIVLPLDEFCERHGES